MTGVELSGSTPPDSKILGQGLVANKPLGVIGAAGMREVLFVSRLELPCDVRRAGRLGALQDAGRRHLEGLSPRVTVASNGVQCPVRKDGLNLEGKRVGLPKGHVWFGGLALARRHRSLIGR